MARLPDIGSLTREQTKQLAKQCLGSMTLDEKIEVIQDSFDDDEIAELTARLADGGL